MIPMSKEILGEELNMTQKVITKWQHKLAAGIPGQDGPATEQVVDEYCREFVAEMLILAGKLETIANIVSADGT